MVGIIRRREQVKVESSFNPDDYFDPVTKTATEADFIRLLEDGIYKSDLIGYKVQLDYGYMNKTWVIADVNHDSENTGQTNCYDLISENLITSLYFDGSWLNWRNSAIRTWIKDNIYNGFSSNFKARTMNIKYKYMSTWYNDDKIILPSCKEVFNYVGADDEGVVYPIFTDNNSRIKYLYDNDAREWWTRSRTYGSDVYIVATNGNISSMVYNEYAYIAPLIRVQ